jgi:hypothetical protein
MTVKLVPGKSIYSSVLENTNFSKVHSVLENSDIENYIQTISSEEILKRKLKKSRNAPIVQKIKNKDEFYKYISYLLQSLTNIGYTTFEIVSFIVRTIEDVKALSEDKEEILKYLSDAICIIHADYSSFYNKPTEKRTINRVLFGHSQYDYFHTGLVFGSTAASILSADAKLYRDLKTLSTFIGASKPKVTLNPALTTSPKTSANSLMKKFNASPLNKNIAQPTKTTTSVSSILINDPTMRVGTQNSLEMSTFFNGLTTLEMNKSYPYMNATFILPTVTSANPRAKKSINASISTAKSSTINQFLFGSNKEKNASSNYHNMAGDSISGQKHVIKTNMSLFSTPQTFVNMNETIGHSQNHNNINRKTTVHDSTQPFMTLKSFTINASATKGLLSYKSGKLSVVLHDRTRMNDIAPFVKPDLFGAFGAEITIEYGWHNSDYNNPSNALGYFIGNSKVIEKYMIVNSSMSMDNNGQVNIELSIAMKGPYEFKNQQISTRVKDRIKQNQFENIVAIIQSDKYLINKDEKSFLQSNNLNTSQYSSLFSEVGSIPSNIVQTLNKFNFKHNFIQTISYDFFSVSKSQASTEVEIEIHQKGKSILSKNQLEIFVSLIKTGISKTEIAAISTSYSKSKSAILKINSEEKASSITSAITSLLDNVVLLTQTIYNITQDDNKERKLKEDILTSIIGQTNYCDHFYPTDDLAYNSINNHADYVSLGAVINTIIQNYVAGIKGQKTSQFDEIQTIFYTANENAGAMAHRNLSSFLIDKNLLSSLLENIFSKRTVITPESLISQILLNIVQVQDNISLGLTDLYDKRTKAEVSLTLKERYKQAKDFDAQKQKLLKRIYFNDPTSKHEAKFVMPVIHMNFDCLTSGSLQDERTILRIAIYDRADDPFKSSSNILENLYTSKYQKAVTNIQSARKKYKSQRSGKNKTYVRQSFQKFQAVQALELKKLTSTIPPILKLDKSSNEYFINYTGLTENSNFIGNVKDIFKEIYPSITFGTQNSPLISANVSTINENKLSTIFMTRPDRNNQSEINNRINVDLPLVILPTQASIEIFGCPWVNFGQSIFLDFETGTTIDNKYVVTGITHNLSPGNFTTQLTLSYGDNYGQFGTVENLLSDNVSSTPLKAIEIKNATMGFPNAQTSRIIINSTTQTSNNPLFNKTLIIKPTK